MIFCYALLLLKGKNNTLGKYKCGFPSTHNFPVSISLGIILQAYSLIIKNHINSILVITEHWLIFQNFSNLYTDQEGASLSLLPALLPSHFLAYWYFSFDLTQVNSLNKFLTFCCWDLISLSSLLRQSNSFTYSWTHSTSPILCLHTWMFLPHSILVQRATGCLKLYGIHLILKWSKHQALHSDFMSSSLVILQVGLLRLPQDCCSQHLPHRLMPRARKFVWMIYKSELKYEVFQLKPVTMMDDGPS